MVHSSCGVGIVFDTCEGVGLLAFLVVGTPALITAQQD